MNYLGIGCVLLSLGASFGCQRSGDGNASAAPSAQGVSNTSARSNPGALLEVGAEVPRLQATAHTGEPVALGELRGKPIVVYFYPKDDTPGCTIEAQEIRDLWQEIQATAATVVGVSTDDADSHRAFADKHGLPFLLLPDPDGSIARAFGVPLENGRARRVSFVFDKQGKLVKVFPSVNPRGHGRELLEVLKGLG